MVHACGIMCMSDLARAHLAALDHLRDGGESRTLNCGYGRGYSVREVVGAVRRVAGVDFEFAKRPVEREIPPQLWQIAVNL